MVESLFGLASVYVWYRFIGTVHRRDVPIAASDSQIPRRIQLIEF